MLNQRYRTALLLVLSLICFECAHAGYLENVKFRIVDEATQEPLKNRELNICRFVFFELKLGAPSPYLNKGAPWYITSVVTDGNGVFVLDLSAVKETHIVVEPGKPYNVTGFTRTSDLAGTKSADHIRVAGNIYDLRNGMVKIITGSGETEEKPFTEILLSAKKLDNELYGESRVVMLQFQQALRDSKWDEALGYCSDNVKSKANDYNSTEAFFRDVVPVEEIASLQQIQTSGGRYDRQGQQVEFHCFLRIPAANSEKAVSWGWTVGESNKGWVIDFETTPLQKRIEKETNRLSREAELAQARIEQLKKGIKFHLTALSKEFVIGQPMLFCVEMTNVSNSPIETDLTSHVMVNNPMVVKGPDGKVIPYVDTSYQTMARSEVIQPGETVALAAEYDVTSQYRIIEPGRYTFKFNCFTPSNVVEIDVKPGELSPADSIVESLLKILPEGWGYTRRVVSRKPTPENPSDKFVSVQLIGEGAKKGEGGGIFVNIHIYLTENEVTVEPDEFAGQLWGRCKWGPVYVRAYDVKLLWPDYREQIIKALDIKEVKSD